MILPSSYSLLIADSVSATWLVPVPRDSTLPAQASHRLTEQQLTGSQLNQLVCILCDQLQSKFNAQSSPSLHCVVASRDPLSVLLACLAVWRLGGVVILPNNLKPATVRELQESTTQDNRGDTNLPLLDDHCLSQARAALESGTALVALALRSEPLRSEIRGDQIALHCYTSGSTGRPLAHIKLGRQLLGEAYMLAQQFMSQLKGPVVCSVPAYHLYGLLFACLAPYLARLPLLGVASVSAGQEFPSPSLRSLAAASRAACLVSVPAHLHSLLAIDSELLDTFSLIFSSSAPLEPSDGQAIRNRVNHPTLVEVWGSTETGGVAARVNDPGGIWQPLPGISVTSQADQLLTVASAFTPCGEFESYFTADKVELCDGGFRHLGRSDGVVKVGGKRISLQDLEHCALRIAEVLDVACVVLEASGLRQQMVGMAVATSSHTLTNQDILTQLSYHFDEVVLPRKFRFLPALPRTATGKIKQSELQQFFAQSPNWSASALPSPFPNTPSPASLSLMQTSSLTPTEELKQSLSSAGFIDIAVDQVPCALIQNQLSFELRTCTDQLWFKGHFPGAPVLPGVVQLHTLVLRSARIAWPKLGKLNAISKVKFKRPIVVGDKLRIQLDFRPHKHDLTFSIKWFDNDGSQISPLLAILPHVFAQPSASEASSGTLSFEASLTEA